MFLSVSCFFYFGGTTACIMRVLELHPFGSWHFINAVITYQGRGKQYGKNVNCLYICHTIKLAQSSVMDENYF